MKASASGMERKELTQSSKQFNKMVDSCCLCKNRRDGKGRKGRNVAFFKFPSDITLRKKWVLATGRLQGWQPGDRAMLCSDHFLKEDIAVPDEQ